VSSQSVAIHVIKDKKPDSNKPSSEKPGGTGLRLAIVKHIAQANKGDVDIESKLGEGTSASINCTILRSNSLA